MNGEKNGKAWRALARLERARADLEDLAETDPDGVGAVALDASRDAGRAARSVLVALLEAGRPEPVAS